LFVAMVLGIKEMRAAVAKSVGWFKRLGLWALALMGWVWNGRRFWLPVFAPIFLWVVISSLVICREQQFRLTGMFLQLLGVATVALRLRATQRQFPWQAVTQWLRLRPRLGVEYYTVISSSGISLGGAGVSARGRVGPGPQSSLEDWLAILERNYVSLFDEVGILGQELKKKTEELSTNLKIESIKREESDNKNEAQLKEAVVGAFHLDLWGVLYFVLGIVAGTASSEIASFLGVAPCK
jgi:hypothetical protein